MKHYRSWLPQIVIGLLISVVYFATSFSIASNTLVIIVTFIVAGTCLQLFYHYFRPTEDKHYLLQTAALIALSFECFVILQMITMLHYTLPPVTEFMFAYVAVMITTIAMVPSLFILGLLIQNGTLEKLLHKAKFRKQRNYS